MSGPKSYSPPPRYSIKVFKGRLNEVFQLQNQLNDLLQHLSTCSVSDPTLNIAFGCNPAATELSEASKNALQSMVFDYKGKFGQETYDQIADEIESRIQELTTLLEKGDAIKKDFLEKQDQYQAYSEFARFRQSSIASFDKFKTLAMQPLREAMETALPELLQETQNRIGQIVLDEALPAFSFSFTQQAAKVKEQLLKTLEQKEGEVHAVRLETSNRALGLYRNLPAVKWIAEEPKATFETPETAAEIANLKSKIEDQIREIPDADQQEAYRKQYESIRSSPSRQQPYYYINLLLTIIKASKQLEYKTAIKALLQELTNPNLIVHPKWKTTKQHLLKRCNDLLNSDPVRDNEMLDIRTRHELWQKQNSTQLAEEALKTKEHQFLKFQILLQLENLGYTVADNLQVIDFDKEVNLLLKTRSGGNYLNLQFREDGSFRYLFKSTVPVKDLSVDQQKSKLGDMQITCDDFQQVLQDLKAMGLNLNIDQEAPIALKSILPLDEKEKKIVNQASNETKRVNPIRRKLMNP